MSRYLMVILVLYVLLSPAAGIAQSGKYKIVNHGFAGGMYFVEVKISRTGFSRSNLLSIVRSLRIKGSATCITFVTNSESKATLFRGKITAAPTGYQGWSSEFRDLGSRFEGPIAQALVTSDGAGFQIWSKESGLQEWAEGAANPYHRLVMGERFDILWLTPIQRMTEGSTKLLADVYARVDGSLTQDNANIIRSELDRELGTRGYLLVHLREDGWFQASNDYPNRNPFDWGSGVPSLSEVKKSPEYYCFWRSAKCEMK